MANYYDILGVLPTSSREELKRCYHHLVREHHPDRNIDQCGTHFRLIDEAWKVLSDDVLRRKYDAELKASESHSVHPVQEEINLADTLYNPELKQYEKNCRCGGYYILSEIDICDELLLVDCDNCSLSVVIDCDKPAKNKSTNS